MSIGECRKPVHTINWHATLGCRSLQLGGFLQYSCGDKTRRKEKEANARMDECLIFLQVPTQNEDSFAVFGDGEFLGQMSVPCPDSLEILEVPVLCEYDIDFETITNLIGGRVR